MYHPAITDYLFQVRRNCPLITAQELDFFARGLYVEELPARTLYLHAGEIPKRISYIVRGLSKGIYTSASGNKVNVHLGWEGRMIGDHLAFVRQIPGKYDIELLESCLLVTIDYNHFCAALEYAPVLERHARILAEAGFAAYLERAESLLIDDAEQRYLQFIRRYPDLFHRLSLTDLSSYLGIQRQSLTRIRHNLREKDL